MKSPAHRTAGYAVWLKRVISTSARILLHASSLGRIRLLGAYLRVQLKNRILVETVGKRITSERVLGQTIRFFDYSAFALVFEEVYVMGAYDFRASGPQPYIVDGGANIGVSVAYFKTIYPECHILAFEADERNFRLLAENAELNGWANTELHNLALHRGDAELPFFVYNDMPGALSNGFWQLASAGPPARVATLRTVPLSRYIDRFVDLLKLDVEGSEHAILQDLAASGALARIGRIVVEYHHHVQADDDRLGQFLCLLEEAGFGYHIFAPLALPFPKGELQTFMLSAYRKTKPAA
jgi:FkbM family methyltransferase